MLSRWLLVLLAALAITISLPIASAQTTTEPAQPLAFEVASIRQNKTPGGWSAQFTPDGYTAMRAALDYIIRDAYGIYDENLWSGLPSWLSEEKFDITAKFDVSALKDPTIDQRRAMMQRLLADRFRLKVHHETKEFPVYNLVVAKDGPKLQPTKPEDIPQGPTGPGCLVQKQRGGITQRQGCPVSSLDTLLRANTGRMVIDKTGLTGRYDFELHWTPENTPADSPDYNGPSIFTALQEQLGLKLEPARAPLDTIVIDHVEQPSEN